MKYAIVNLGCKVNAFEAEAVSEMLSNNGHTRVSFDEQPDATIVFTCAERFCIRQNVSKKTKSLR